MEGGKYFCDTLYKVVCNMAIIRGTDEKGRGVNFGSYLSDVIYKRSIRSP